MKQKLWVDGKKHCSKCGRWLDPSAFHRNQKRWDGLHGNCKPCMAAFSRTRYESDTPRLLKLGKDYRAANSGKRMAAQIKARFGLSIAEFNAILQAQGHVCAICKRPPNRKRLHIDHDHVTGIVRGLLCFRCNMALGYFGDNPDALRAGAEYLCRQRTAA